MRERGCPTKGRRRGGKRSWTTGTREGGCPTKGKGGERSWTDHDELPRQVESLDGNVSILQDGRIRTAKTLKEFVPRTILVRTPLFPPAPQKTKIYMHCVK